MLHSHHHLPIWLIIYNLAQLLRLPGNAIYLRIRKAPRRVNYHICLMIYSFHFFTIFLFYFLPAYDKIILGYTILGKRWRK
nr:MAG TPA: hypothetical protein [Caudoviricetes sp.]